MSAGTQAKLFACLVLVAACKDEAREAELAKAQAAASAATGALVQAQASAAREAESAKAQAAASLVQAQASAAAAATLASAAQAQAVQNVQLEETRRRNDEKNGLLSSPERYLEAYDYQNTTKGIVNKYGQLIGVTVRNRSRFTVQDPEGSATWGDKSGNTLGSVPFTLMGSIPAGGTQEFSIRAGNLTTGPALQGAIMPPVVRFKLTLTNIIDSQALAPATTRLRPKLVTDPPGGCEVDGITYAANGTVWGCSGGGNWCASGPPLAGGCPR